ncbi:MAG: DUF3341 domain-containing protein [Chloroflexi bacterium]|nr:DUF3341 domain-containing protein [Chloroflexota bacterium]
MTTFIPKRSLLGLFSTADGAADAVEGLQAQDFDDKEFEIMSGTPYPEGAFGEKTTNHRLYVFPFIGAALGFAVAILLTTATQVSYPLVTGGKPILSIPPMAIITYEGTMLGAIIFTVLGIIFESRLPRPKLGLYDTRITEGYVGILVTTTEDRFKVAKEILTKAGAEDIKEGEPD